MKKLELQAIGFTATGDERQLVEALRQRIRELTDFDSKQPLTMRVTIGHKKNKR